MEAARSPPWADLQPELLGQVLRWLPSLLDRVRLRAVCRSWRSNARLQPLPPPLPWLTLLDGTFLSIPDGEIIRLSLPDNASCCGSIDNWLFLMQTDGACSLVNPFTKAELDLPKLASVWRRHLQNAVSGCVPRFYKLVVPSSLDSSPDSIVVALILDDNNCSTVCICQPPIATDVSSERDLRYSHHLSDVLFFHGKLYGADCVRLVIFEISYELDGKPMISSIEHMDNSKERWYFPQPLLKENIHVVREYLVECCGRLLMVERLIQVCHLDPGHDFFEHARTVAFEVFEADLSTKPGRWRCVNDFGGQALFIGRHCSKSLLAREYTEVQEDSIYFMCDYALPDSAANPLRDSGVYNIRTGMIKPLLSETAVVPQHRGGQGRPTWVFPSDAM